MRRACLMAMGLLLGGCGNDWFGEAPPPPLPGERISILELGDGLESDPDIAGLPVVLPPPETNAEWPQFGGGPDKAMHQLAAPGPLAGAWSQRIGSGQSGSRRLVGTPVVAAGRVFTIDSGTLVSAFDAGDGGPIWQTDVAAEEDDGWGGGLAHDGGLLFATTGNGEVLALDPADGSVLWRVAAGPPLRTPPAAAQGRIFVVTPDNRLLALDAATGNLLWTHQGFPETASLMGGGSPSIAGSFVIVTYTSGEVVTLRAENGREVWSDSLAQAGQTGVAAILSDINGSAVIDRDLVFVASYGGSLAAIDLVRGVRIWEQDVSATQTPWVAGDHLWVVTVDGRVVCLLRDDGRVRWIAALPRYEDPSEKEGAILWSGPVLAGGRLLLAGSHGELAVLAPDTGSVVEMRAMDRGLPLAPVVADGRIYLVGASGTMTVLR